MGLKKYRFDITKPNPDGSVMHYARWMAGDTLSGVSNCLCQDGKRRTVYVRGEADTFFSIPAATSIKGKTVRGYLTINDDGNNEFRADNANARKAMGLPLLPGEE